MTFISHDHLDYSTILKIDSRVKKYIVPLGTDSCLRGWGIDEKKYILSGGGNVSKWKE